MALSLPGPIALRAVADAEANVGVTEEGGENRGKWVETYLASVGLTAGAPWCAAFVYFRLQKAATTLAQPLPADFPRSGYCPDFKAWGIKHGVWVPATNAKANPALIKRGDLLLFYFASKQRVAHIGIVSSVRTDGVFSVEGNTGPESGEVVNREGDGVYKKDRGFGELGYYGGFVRLSF